MTLQFSNFSKTALTADVPPTDTTIHVASSASFPSAPFRAIIDLEIIEVTAVAGVAWTATRGVEGTSAAYHASGQAVQHGLTAASLTGWSEEVTGKVNAEDLGAVAFSNDYDDLDNKPDIGGGGVDQVNSDWNATDGVAEILNKPTLFDGAYSSLTGKPTIPSVQVNTDWNSGSGVSQLLNKPTLVASATTDTTNAANISSGTLPAARLPNPAVSTLGGVKSHAATTHQFITAIGTDGVVAAAQPAASDISGLATSATTDTTNATNIASGTLAVARGGTGQGTTTAALNALMPSQTSNSGKVLQTDGTNTSWATVSASPGGSDKQFQFNDSGSFGGNLNVVLGSGVASNNIDCLATRQIVVDYQGEALCNEAGGNTQGLYFGPATGTGIVCVQNVDGDYVLKFYVGGSAVAYIGADGSWNQGTPDCPEPPDPSATKYTVNGGGWTYYSTEPTAMTDITSGDTVNLDTDDGGLTDSQIDWGEGGGFTGALPDSHEYDNGGDYTVTVHLIGAAAQETDITFTLHVDGGNPPPDPVADLTAACADPSTIHLTWSNGGNGWEISIQRSGDSITWENAVTNDAGIGDTGSWDDTSLSGGVLYYRAWFSSFGQDSDPSDPVNANTDDCL